MPAFMVSGPISICSGLWSQNIPITTRLVDSVSTPMLLDTAASKRIEPKRLTTHHFQFDQIIDAYDTFSRAAETGALKVMIEARMRGGGGEELDQGAADVKRGVTQPRTDSLPMNREFRLVPAGMVRALAPVLLAAALLLLPAAQAAAQESGTGVHELAIGTKEAPPFAIKDAQGKWSGISIDLWRRVADKLKLQYHFVEMPSVPALLDGVAKGNLDMAVAAITVTPERERQVDFTMPYFNAGTGVAVPVDRFASWIPVIRSLTSYGFLQALAALLGLAVLSGALIWLFEHRANEGFSGGLARGIGTGVWWSANTMAQRAGGSDPMTVPGRIIATVWMIASVIAIAVFTAGITSALTTRRLRGAVNTVADLSSVKVATVQGTATEDTLSQMRIKYKMVGSLQDGFQALQKGKIDALAYDRPILAWMIRQGGLSAAELTDVTFQPQSYAIALQSQSTLRRPINITLLETVQSDWWKNLLFRYLGQTTN